MPDDQTKDDEHFAPESGEPDAEQEPQSEAAEPEHEPDDEHYAPES